MLFLFLPIANLKLLSISRALHHLLIRVRVHVRNLSTPTSTVLPSPTSPPTRSRHRIRFFLKQLRPLLLIHAPALLPLKARDLLPRERFPVEELFLQPREVRELSDARAPGGEGVGAALDGDVVRGVGDDDVGERARRLGVWVWRAGGGRGAARDSGSGGARHFYCVGCGLKRGAAGSEKDIPEGGWIRVLEYGVECGLRVEYATKSGYGNNGCG
jgi:hypothetical protein